MAREDFINFLVNYGGRCRDCADENGFCPGTGIGCGQRRKAVEFILGAIDYGTKHGFSHGYQIIHRDENHGPTLERAASKADSLNFVHHVGGGRKLEKTQALIEPSRIASAIRAMEVKNDA